jgi:hypothetical protein
LPPPAPTGRPLDQAEQWLAEHQNIVDIVFGEFDRTGRWPDLDELQRHLLRDNNTVDVITASEHIPAMLGRVEHTGEIILKLRTLATCAAARPLMAAFAAVIKLAVDRYLGLDPNPKICRDDLTGTLSLDTDTTVKLSKILFEENWAFSGATGDAATDEWELNVGRHLRQFREVETIEDYLAVQARLQGLTPAEPRTSLPAPSATVPPLDRPLLFSERKTGRRRAVEADVLTKLAVRGLADLQREGHFREAFNGGGWDDEDRNGPITHPPAIPDPESWMMLNLGRDDVWPELADLDRTLRQLAEHDDELALNDPETLFDVLELFHDQVVSLPVEDEDGVFEGFFSKKGGEEGLREKLNPILAACDPPMEMRTTGQIAPLAAPGLEPLSDQPLPPETADADMQAKVEAAVCRFRRRGANREDQLAALNELAGVLERLQHENRLDSLPRKDEARLREIANNYGIRHHRPGQKHDWGPAFREWIFHSYLAAIRLALRSESDPAARRSPTVR